MQLLVRGLTVDKVVVVCILVNAYTTYPCLVLVIQARGGVILLYLCLMSSYQLSCHCHLGACWIWFPVIAHILSIHCQKLLLR